MIGRRGLLLGGAVGAASLMGARARAALQSAMVPASAPLATADFHQREPDLVLPLWPVGAIPSPAMPLQDNLRQFRTDVSYPDRTRGGVSRPDLAVFRPRGAANGGAALVIPGGAYHRVGVDRERDIAAFLSDRGFCAAVVSYRLPHEGWAERATVPLNDARRAMQLLRAHAENWRFRADDVHLLGLSAGGNLAATLMVDHASNTRGPVDAVDHVSAAPRSVALLYPVITMDGPAAHRMSRDNLLGPSPSPDLVAHYSMERRITPGLPPIFIASAQDDRPVPIANSYALAAALAAAGVPHETHVFRTGGHGFALRVPGGTSAAMWLDLYLRWLQGNRATQA